MATSVLEQNIALLGAEYEARTGQAVPFNYGRLAEHELGVSPPRILWLHRGGRHEQAGRIRQTRFPIPPRDARSDQPPNAEPLGWAWEELEIRCWGADSGAADTLWRNVCTLLLLQLGASIDLRAFSWLTEEQSRASPFTEGAVKVQLAAWRMIVPADLVPLTEIDSFDHTGTFGADDGCQCTT